MNIRNPILPGFNPDPSILRVGDDYYIATSTFEWFPGVQIHHSRDLVHWRLLTRPLNRASQLNMLGDPDSCGIWAPCLTHADGLFWLIYTDVKRYGRTTVGGASGASLRDFPNYLVTSPRIDGDWSDPIDLNSSGFDPSLFHDDDGRKYLVNMLWDFRPGKNRFAGIVLQEYSVKQRRLIGERKNIFKGTPLGLTEGPHLYKRNGWYYLLTAEGGTSWDHTVTLARSRNIGGPYELHPDKHILSARNRPDCELQKSGHASLVDTQNGETYMVYLCGRPLKNRGRCTLGRETAIQKMVWGKDGWLRTLDGQGIPTVETPGPELPGLPLTRPSDTLSPNGGEGRGEGAATGNSGALCRYEFDLPQLPVDFQWLRTPWPEEIFSLTARPGFLRLFGRDTIGSLFKQSLVARRQQAHCYSAATVIEFEPEHFQQMAGLVCYYNGAKFHYLHISHDETVGKHLRVMSCLPDSPQADAFTPPVAIPTGKPVHLRVEIDYERLHFGYRVAGEDKDWRWLPQQFDASILSDDACAPGTPNFTGAFVGIACQDMAGTARPADFDFFEYRERNYQANPFSA
ncbi:MAG TPA: glycoside hydrolase family 43 protein [Verrucomicrobiae bacterium]|nr:glycoside hydrolase family 43 protein [Verrucomicrobiae bacterium]